MINWLKKALKKWALCNIFEISTWVGLVIVVRELMAPSSSVLMLTLGVVLMVVSDSRLNLFILHYARPLRNYIDQL